MLLPFFARKGQKMEQTVFEMIISTISQVGFPIAISIFLIWKDYKVSETVLTALTDFKATLLNLNENIEKILERSEE